MRRFALFLLLSFISTINALHFYLDANQKRCFIEELPTDTVVEGLLYFVLLLSSVVNYSLLPGRYRALEWSEEREQYVGNSELGIVVDVHVRNFNFTIHKSCNSPSYGI